MIRHLPHHRMGRGQLDWLQTYYHFSFSEYYNPANIRFGNLRVLNDDTIAPRSGFGMHPHRDMEILTYVLSGHLTHRDSLGHQGSVGRGQVQYMSAGTGIFHSEHNEGDEPLRLLQIWILPDREGHSPAYGEHAFPWDHRVGHWLLMAGPAGSGAPISIHQDVKLLATELPAGQSLDYAIGAQRQAYLVLAEGSGKANGITLSTRDALEITGESLRIEADQNAHFVLLEMAQPARA